MAVTNSALEAYITALTEDTTPDTAADMLMEFDDSATGMKKLKLATLLALASGSGGVGADGWAAADTMTYAAADDPTFTMTCTGDQSTKYYPGMRIKLTQSTGGIKYFVITAVAYTSSTTLTLYGGTDYNLENEAISSPYYSSAKAPAGFPLDPTKWTVEVTSTSDLSQASPTSDAWYNLGTTAAQITIPIGIWQVSFSVVVAGGNTTGANVYMFAALSTANNSASDADLSGHQYVNKNDIGLLITRTKALSLAAKTLYYLNGKMVSTGNDLGIRFENTDHKMIIRAACAYL